MHWLKGGVPGLYFTFAPGRDYKIERRPYGTKFSFQGYWKDPNASSDSWERIPLCFSMRLRDVKSNIESRAREFAAGRSK